MPSISTVKKVLPEESGMQEMAVDGSDGFVWSGSKLATIKCKHVSLATK